ncbi:MAG: hypothetical protein ACJ8CC_02260 [Microvirga sp.]
MRGVEQRPRNLGCGVNVRAYAASGRNLGRKPGAGRCTARIQEFMMKKVLLLASAAMLLAAAPAFAQQSSTGQSSGGPAVSRGGPGSGPMTADPMKPTKKKAMKKKSKKM